MGDFNNQYIKFMSDIIDSGLWGKLSPAAKTLYPVLLKFSDQNFKQVWPATETLLKLTGFRTKKSIVSGKKELMREGLLQYKPGSGRTNSTYYFSFNYEGSKITPQWDKKLPLSGLTQSLPDDSFYKPQGNASILPNNLNITINNTQSPKPEIQKKSATTYDKLMDVYGFSLVESALRLAKAKGMENNLSYVAGVCKNLAQNSGRKKPVFNHEIDTAQHVIDSWENFLEWCKSHLTRSSVDILEAVSIDVDGQTIFINQNLSEFLKQIILKYFQEEISPHILIVFPSNSTKTYRYQGMHAEEKK